MSRNFAYILNSSELTAGTRGASLGPAAVMTAARKIGSHYFGSFPVTTLPVFNHVLDHPITTPHAKYIAALSEVRKELIQAILTTVEATQFPVVLAGDHGSAAGTIAAIQLANPGKRLGVIWIDAHADIHSPYTTPSGNMHGMPLAVAMQMDHKHLQRNEPNAETIAIWEELKGTAQGISPLKASDLVYVAVRDTEPEEDQIIAELGISNHTVAECRENGIPSIVTKINERLKECDLIYISFDVDSMDPDVVSYGTGTPVKDGLHPEEARELLTLLMNDPKVCCLEVVEVNPCLDNKINTMAETTFDILQSIVPQNNTQK